MMADHEKGNSIAEKSGAAPIQIQGETVSKYDGLGSFKGEVRRNFFIGPKFLSDPN